MDQDLLIELGETLASEQQNAVIGFVTDHGQLTLNVKPEHLIDLLTYLRDHPNMRFSTLVDITAVDWPSKERRFEVVYHLLSMHSNQRLRLICGLREDETMPSSTGVYPAADWFEREVYDMFGILFVGHPDLRRLLTDYGFRGHPLRKDFPTTGYVEIRYDEELKRVVYEPVKLVQEYRSFDFMSPWEGAEYVLEQEAKKDGEGPK